MITRRFPMCKESAVGSNPAYIVCGEDSKIDLICGLEDFIHEDCTAAEWKNLPSIIRKDVLEEASVFKFQYIIRAGLLGIEPFQIKKLSSQH